MSRLGGVVRPLSPASARAGVINPPLALHRPIWKPLPIFTNVGPLSRPTPASSPTLSTFVFPSPQSSSHFYCARKLRSPRVTRIDIRGCPRAPLLHKLRSTPSRFGTASRRSHERASRRKELAHSRRRSSESNVILR